MGTFPAITEADGALSVTGMAKEVGGYGVPAVATNFLPNTGNTMEVDPGWFSPTLMMGIRDKQVYNLQGEESHAGALDGPIFPSNAMPLLVASIGADGLPGAGVTGAAATSATVITAAVTAGTNTFTLSSPSGYAVGSYIQLDVNGTGPTTTSECRLIKTLSGSSGTVDTNWVYGHLVNAPVHVVTAPFTHSISQQNSLPSLTVEKNIGNVQSLQWAGSRVNKLDLKMPVGNEACSLTADMMAQSVAILDTPTGVNVTPELPFVFTEASVSFYGSQRFESANLTVSIDNALKGTWTYSGNHGPSFITPISLHVSGSLDMVWSSLDSSTYGDFNRMYNQTLGVLNVTLAHPASGGSIALQIPQIALSKYANDLKAEDLIMSSLTWEASRPQTGSSLYTIAATVINSVWTAY